MGRANTITHAGVYHCKALIIVLLDLFKNSRLLECGDIPVQVSQPAVNSRVSVPNVANVALEEGDVDNVEPDERDVEKNVHY
jgi:hypothetical protein